MVTKNKGPTTVLGIISQGAVIYVHLSSPSPRICPSLYHSLLTARLPAPWRLTEVCTKTQTDTLVSSCQWLSTALLCAPNFLSASPSVPYEYWTSLSASLRTSSSLSGQCLSSPAFPISFLHNLCVSDWNKSLKDWQRPHIFSSVTLALSNIFSSVIYSLPSLSFTYSQNFSQHARWHILLFPFNVLPPLNISTMKARTIIIDFVYYFVLNAWHNAWLKQLLSRKMIKS